MYPACEFKWIQKGQIFHYALSNLYRSSCIFESWRGNMSISLAFVFLCDSLCCVPSWPLDFSFQELLGEQHTDSVTSQWLGSVLLISPSDLGKRSGDCGQKKISSEKGCGRGKKERRWKVTGGRKRMAKGEEQTRSKSWRRIRSNKWTSWRL